MASLVYNSFLQKLGQNNVDLEADTFKMMLVTSAYTPDKDAHDFRNDVTNEVVGTGYTAGGAAVAVTPSLDTANDQYNLTFANPSWPSSTITARAGVIYKSRGGASSADELVAYVDFGTDVVSTAGTFTVTFNSPLRFSNP